jgi:UDP-N-acetylmuramoyl-L-alanyl-D-glutamate--2,6-diaminopimelate ligase
MKIYGITGTNGKTTTAWILRTFLGGGGLITTVEVDTGRRRFSTGYTTPPLPVLRSIFEEMSENGCTSCVMEVSSHAIHQRRTGETVFSGGIFTNLTEDHLDYHKTMDAYFQVKADFFRRLAVSTPGAVAAICVDAEPGRRLAEICDALPLTVRRYGWSVSDPRRLAQIEKTCPLVGRYNVQNVLGAAALAEAEGVAWETIAAALPGLTPRWGRLEPVKTRSAAAVYIDYAHTDDALANVLSAVRPSTVGRVWAVFGAGGDRDRAKRPLMGAAAAAHADRLVVTSDNPRGEDPNAIMAEIAAGIPAGTAVTLEPDRAAAIRFALAQAEAGDTVVVCGKGHETVQVIGEQAIPFSDRDVCEKF